MTTELYTPWLLQHAGVTICLPYDAEDPTTVLGGLIRTSGITNRNLYSIIEIFLLFHRNYNLQHQNGMNVPRDEQPLQAGKYNIITTDTGYLFGAG